MAIVTYAWPFRSARMSAMRQAQNYHLPPPIGLASAGG